VLTDKTLVACVLTLVLAVPISGASAQTPSSDPAADTPAGTVYKLPLDDARGDAAPRRPAGSGSLKNGSVSGSGDATTSSPKSPLRSENGFGSSSIVPGTEDSAGATGGSSKGAKAGSGGDGSGAGRTPSSGTEPQPDGNGATAQRAADSGGSSARVYGLLALVLAVGIAGGMASRMGLRKLRG